MLLSSPEAARSWTNFLTAPNHNPIPQPLIYERALKGGMQETHVAWPPPMLHKAVTQIDVLSGSLSLLPSPAVILGRFIVGKWGNRADNTHEPSPWPPYFRRQKVQVQMLGLQEKTTWVIHSLFSEATHYCTHFTDGLMETQSTSNLAKFK